MEFCLSLIILFPILGGALIALAGSGLHRRFSELAACGAVGGAFAASLAAFLGYRNPVTVQPGRWLSVFDLSAPFSLSYDPLAAVMCLMVTFVSGLILVYSVNYMAGEADHARFFSLMSLFVGAMLLLVLAGNLPLMFLGWEGVGFCSYALIGFWYGEEKNATAGRKAFLVTRIGDVAFSIAIFWLFTLCGTVSISTVNGMAAALPAGVVTAVGFLLLGGAMGKSAQMPLMVWLPDAMAGPTPVSALIHAATMVTAGVYLLIRFFPLIGSSAPVCAAIAITGGLTAFYAASCALAQRDLKRILAYSTMSQIGYMMLGVGSGALTAATFHLVEHSFYKSLLFLGAGCVITALSHEQDIFRMGGLRRAMPGAYWPFLAGAACLAGLPLTGGFFSKDGILEAVFARGGPLYLSLYVVGVFTAFLTVIYTFRMVFVVFHGDDRKIHDGVHSMEKILVPLALLGFFGEIMNLPAYLGMGSWLDDFLGFTGSGHGRMLPRRVEIGLQLLAAAVAVGGLLLARARYGNGRGRESERESSDGFRGFLANGWYFDELYRVLFVEPFLGVARFLRDPVEEGVVVPLPDRIGAKVADGGRFLAKWSCGRVSVYLASFAGGGALLLGYLAWLLF
ncbi:MAG: NADH-quinone oxidoreductase subunit L [Geobacteraceae bacterium]|nr:NADH-quinone oxidoreductase subunit L [Geobacteraceae bacterium]